MPPPTLASIGVVLDADGRVLLVKSVDERRVWAPPGGMVEPGESPQQAVVRELREEVGVEAEAGPLVAVYTLRRDDRTHYRFVFRCTIDREPFVAAPDEVEELGWFDPSQLPEPTSRTGPFAVADAVAGRVGVTREIDD